MAPTPSPPHKNHLLPLPIITIVHVLNAQLVTVFQVDAADDDEIAAAGASTILNKGAYGKLKVR